jgi:hypothetical protein
MTRFQKSVMISCLIEIPLLMLLSTGTIGRTHGPLTFLLWYHFISLSVASGCWLILFGHGAPYPGNPLIWQMLYISVVFLIQVAITTPIVYWGIVRGANLRNASPPHLAERE